MDASEGERAEGKEEEARERERGRERDRQREEIVLFKNSAKKSVLYGVMAVNILWKVSGNALRATMIYPAVGLSKVRTVLWSFL